MTLVAMGLGTRKAPAGANLDPTEGFWSFLSMVPKLSGKNQSGIISGLKLAPSSKKTMAVTVGGDPSETDAGVVKIGRRLVLVSNTGDPATIELPAADTAGAFNAAIALYIDSSKPEADKETAGTPQYVKTLVAKGKVGARDSFYDPTAAQAAIEAALPASAGGAYLYLGWVNIAANASSLSNDDCHPVDSCVPSTADIREKLRREVDQLKADVSQTAKSAYQKAVDVENSIGKFCHLVRGEQTIYAGTDGWRVDNLPSFDGDYGFAHTTDNTFVITSPGTYIIRVDIDMPQGGDNIAWRITKGDNDWWAPLPKVAGGKMGNISSTAIDQVGYSDQTYSVIVNNWGGENVTMNNCGIKIVKII